MRDEKEYVSKIKELLLREKLDGVVIYGAGDYGKKLYHILGENMISVHRFVVTNKSYNAKKLMGKDVVSIDEMDDNNYLFLIAAKHPSNVEMINKLREYGKKYYLDIPEDFAIYSNEYNSRPTMEFTLKIGCSVNCKYCPQEVFIKKYIEKNNINKMTLEMFKNYLNKIPKNVFIEFGGFVEPFLNPDATEMIQYAISEGYDVCLFTTLVGLTLEKFNKIKNLPFYKVTLHLPDKNQYAKIPLTEEYYELLDEILKAKKPDGTPFVDIANCQCEPNEDVMNVVKDNVLVTWDKMMDRAGNLEDENLLSTSKIYGKITCSRTKRLSHNVLLPDGTVLLCCMDWSMKHMLGNLNTDTYKEIDEGEAKRNLFKEMMCEDSDILCRKCTVAVKDVQE